MVVKVFIEEKDGKITEIEMSDAEHESCTVLQLRRRTHRDRSQLLIFNDRLLEDAAKLSDYGIKHKSTIHSFVKSTKLTLFIKNHKGKIFDIRLDEDEFKSCLVLDLKRRLRALEGTHEDQQRMIYSGKQLEDSRTLSDYEIQDTSIIHIVLRLRGGGILDPAKGDGGMGDKGGKNRSMDNLLLFQTGS